MESGAYAYLAMVQIDLVEKDQVKFMVDWNKCKIRISGITEVAMTKKCYLRMECAPDKMPNGGNEKSLNVPKNLLAHACIMLGGSRASVPDKKIAPRFGKEALVVAFPCLGQNCSGWVCKEKLFLNRPHFLRHFVQNAWVSAPERIVTVTMHALEHSTQKKQQH